MSKSRKLKVECPSCKHSQEITAWEMVDANENPELKDAMLSNAAFDFKCEKCEKGITVVYPCLYHDKDKKLMIYFIPNAADKEIQKLNKVKEENPESIFNVTEPGYEFRMVRNRNEFKDKILIRDEGLDDRIVEIVKLIYYNQLAKMDEKTKPVNSYFINDGEYKLVHICADKQVRYTGFSKELYDKVAADFNFGESDSFMCIGPKWANAMMAAKANPESL